MPLIIEVLLFLGTAGIGSHVFWRWSKPLRQRMAQRQYRRSGGYSQHDGGPGDPGAAPDDFGDPIRVPTAPGDPTEAYILNPRDQRPQPKATWTGFEKFIQLLNWQYSKGDCPLCEGKGFIPGRGSRWHKCPGCGDTAEPAPARFENVRTKGRSATRWVSIICPVCKGRGRCKCGCGMKCVTCKGTGQAKKLA